MSPIVTVRDESHPTTPHPLTPTRIDALAVA